MRYLRKYDEGFMLSNNFDTSIAEYFFAVGLEDAVDWAQGKREPSGEPFTSDYDVLKTAYGDDYNDLTDEEKDDWINGICSWYDPKHPEWVDKSLNISRDFENAEGWDEVVIGIKPTGSVADFTSGHSMLEDCHDLEIIFFYYENNGYTTEEFLNLDEIKQILINKKGRQFDL